MSCFDPAHRAAELRALVEQLRGRQPVADHHMRGKVRFVAGTYTLSHLGVTGTSICSAADAMRSWCCAADRRVVALEAPAPRLPQPVRS